jgi:hypothetical protein
MESGAVAIQQALVKHFGLSYRDAAKIAGVNPRTLWQHVAARRGSNVAAWESRSETIKNEAIEKAHKLTELKQ